MRIAIPMRRRVLAGALFGLALIALLPLRLAIAVLPFEAAGIGARTVTGPIWAGRIGGLTWRGVALGDVDARVEVLPLLLGRIRLSVGGAGIEGALIASPGGAGVEELTTTLPVEGLLPGVPLAALTTDTLSVRFADGRCLRAGGRVTARVAALTGTAIAQGLAGAARCDGAALLLPLTGPSGLERLDLRLFGDGRWRARLTLSGGAGSLVPQGFTSGRSGLVLERDGRF